MAIDTDLLYSALGSFFELFPEEERARVTSFWSNFGEKTADLIGRAIQVRDSESIFRTQAFVERRFILAQFRELIQDPITEFRLVSVDDSTVGFTIFRGKLPSAKRVRGEVVPNQGQLIIGSDILDYTESNLEIIGSGVREGRVTEATFTVPDPLRDYKDPIDPNETFPVISTALTLRRDHIAFEGVIDATGPVGLNLNKRGRISTGGESFEYESLVVVSDRYLFTLATTFHTPPGTGQSLPGNLSLGEPVTVNSYDEDRWSDDSVGPVRVATSPLTLFVDDGPVVLPARGAITADFELRDGADFDVAMSVSLEKWLDPLIDNTSRTAGMGMRVGANKYVIGANIQRDGVGTVTHHIAWGPENGPSFVDLSSAPSDLQVRIERAGANLEFLYRFADGEPWASAGILTTTAERARPSFIIIDDGTDEGSEVQYDELERFVGEVVGSDRLERAFQVTSRFPNRYLMDIDIAAADELLDRPAIREETLTITEEVTDTQTLSITCSLTEETERAGIPKSGLLVIGGEERIYDELILNNGTVTFNLRMKLPPDLFPIASGLRVSAKTRNILDFRDEYEFPEPGVIRMRELPTRDRMWAPVAQVDERLMQRLWAPLVRSGATRTSSLFTERLIKGHWSALFGGPTMFNLLSGLSLTMGLPVAEVAGVVSSITESRDELGRLVERSLTVRNDEGEYVHLMEETTSPLIDWLVEVGAPVERFQALTNGVQVLDLNEDPDWPDRFQDVADAERFRSFGVFLDVSALGPESSISDTLRFALRIKPNDSKLFIGLFTDSLGDEDLSDDLDDQAALASLLLPCEEMAFDEGPVPPGAPLTLGKGYKLGTGLILGDGNVRRFLTLGTGLHLGTGLKLGQSLIYFCEPVPINLPTEEETVTQVIGVAVPP